MSAIYADITTLVQYYQSLGARVIVLTILPRLALSGASETARVSLNGLITANTAGADAVADVAADSRLQNINDTAYFNGDKTHLNATGNGAVGGIVQPYITALAA